MLLFIGPQCTSELIIMALLREGVRGTSHSQYQRVGIKSHEKKCLQLSLENDDWRSSLDSRWQTVPCPRSSDCKSPVAQCRSINGETIRGVVADNWR